MLFTRSSDVVYSVLRCCLLGAQMLFTRCSDVVHLDESVLDFVVTELTDRETVAITSPQELVPYTRGAGTIGQP